MNQKFVGAPVVKKNAHALVTGRPVFTGDMIPSDSLVVKLLRSPHAHAKVVRIDATRARELPGVECVLTHHDVPKRRFSPAGQTFPEPSPYDRYILEDRVRFVGDPVAIVAAESEQAAEKALKRIKVEYEVLPAVLDPRQAKDNPILVHPEEDWTAKFAAGADNKRNLCASASDCHGDIDAVLADCDIVIERTYSTQANQQAMMETFRASSWLEANGRLVLNSSTQVPFHVRRNVAAALDIPNSKVRVCKPAIGGGFGAKQTAVCEVYPAIVTWKTGRPAHIIFSRYESMIASSPRHPMEVTVKVGAMSNGLVRGIDLHTLSDTGAYGEHGPTTVGLSGHKTIPLYAKQEAFRFSFDVVYTNHMASGAYRGYGATQGIFAVESIMNELADILEIDPAKLRELNMVRQGDVMPAYYGETANSCTLDRCVERVKEMIGWEYKLRPRTMPNGKVRAVGMAMTMQGSGVSNVDVGSVNIRLSDDGFYMMNIGATDMGTGCDTILAQIAADVLESDINRIEVAAIDTDISPYDSGSYASATTYVTGMACIKACEQLRDKIVVAGARLLRLPSEQCGFDGQKVYCTQDETLYVALGDIGTAMMCGSNDALEVTVSTSSPVSPPPFMAGAAEVEVDLETGEVTLLDYVAAVDCGTPINPALCQIQAEGGLLQGIGMALYEDVVYDAKGVNLSNSFLQYRIPTRLDAPSVRVVIEPSFEPTGPFGAKSIGEIVINTPAPAIADAVARASGVRIRNLPITAEKIAMGRLK